VGLPGEPGNLAGTSEARIAQGPLGADLERKA
jgi:hypothetical protein